MKNIEVKNIVIIEGNSELIDAAEVLEAMKAGAEFVEGTERS